MKGNKTLAIFGVAVSLLLAAMVFGLARNKGTAVNVPTPPVTLPTPLVEVGAPHSSGQVGEALKMTGRLSHGHLLKGAESSTAFLLVDVDAATEALNKQVPLDLAIVVDRSGSMIGDKLDEARRAARELVGKLRPGDRVALVSYSTNITIEVPLVDAESGRQSLLSAIDGLTAVGGTHISGGLETGQQILKGAQSGNRVRRIILLSDGHATAGLTEPAELGRLAAQAREAGITITSMGLGVDYNEKLMAEIARQGGGNYYFIERSASLSETFDKEFSTLTASIARDAAVVVELAPGVAARQVFGFAHTIEGRRITVPMSEFYAGQNKSLLVELSVAGAAEGLVDVAKLELAYLDLRSDSPARFELSLSMATADDAEAVEASRDREVYVRREQILTASAYEDAMQRYESGEREQAQQILSERNRQMRQSNVWLKSETLDAEAASADSTLGDLGNFGSGSAEGKAAIKSNRARSLKLQLAK